jgi:hypothetical protein
VEDKTRTAVAGLGFSDIGVLGFERGIISPASTYSAFYTEYPLRLLVNDEPWILKGLHDSSID